MPGNRGDVVIKVTADTTALQKGMRRGGKIVADESQRMQVGIGDVSKRVQRMGQGFTAVTPLLSSFGSVGSSQFAAVGSSATALGSILSGGLGIGIVTTLLVSAGAAVANLVAKSEAAKKHFAALNEEFGISRQQVDDVRAALEGAGVSVDDLAAQKITRLAQESGLTSVEVGELADRIKRLATLDGIDPTAAAEKVFSAYIAAAKQTKKVIDEVLGRVADRTSGATSNMTQLAVQSDKANQALAAADQKIASLSAKLAPLQAEVAAAQANPFAPGTASRLEEINPQIAKLTRELASARRESDTAKASLNALGEAAGQVADAESDDRRMAAFEKTQTAARAAVRAQMDVSASTEEQTQQTTDFILNQLHRVRIEQAQASGDRRAELIENARFEIAQEEAKVEAMKGSQEAFKEWRAAREQQLQNQLATLDQRGAEEVAGQTKDAVNSALSDKQRNAVAGLNAGSTFVSGFRQALESDDAKGAFQSFLGLFSSLLSTFGGAGGAIGGGILGFLGSLFHDGGMIGSGGAGGRRIPKFHTGGMIVAHRGVMLMPSPLAGEVPIMAQTGEGVLSRSGVAALGGPSMVNALNNGGGIRGGNTTVNVVAFDPRSMAQVIGQVVEPVQYRRGVTRADAKTLAGLRRRVRAPRTGR